MSLRRTIRLRVATNEYIVQTRHVVIILKNASCIHDVINIGSITSDIRVLYVVTDGLWIKYDSNGSDGL